VTYSGVYTGELHDSMQWRIEPNTSGVAAAYLGSGALDGKTMAQAALNWYSHKDPSGLQVRPDYPRWKPDHIVRTDPTHPYEKAMDELGIEHTYNPDWEAWATEPGRQRGGTK
jgi:hypothetical protein